MHVVILHVSKKVFMFVKEFKISTMKHVPQIVKETAMDIVLDMHNREWFDQNDITDPRFALEFLCDRIMVKYLEHCFDLPKKHKIFSKMEFQGIQDRIIQNNLLMILKRQGIIAQVEDGNDYKFLLTPKGINNLPFILKRNLLWQD